jgi:hypothetical protein
VSAPEHTCVFHRGALGDSILLWPRLRSELRAGRRVTLVTDGEKARLAEAELGGDGAALLGLDTEQPRFNDLWRRGTPVEPEGSTRLVVCAGGGGDVDGVWGCNARRMFPNARFEAIGRPSRALYRGEDASAGVAIRRNPRGPVVAHIGAGSESKRWPMDGWATLAAFLHRRGHRTELVAGEVERERLPAAERTMFLSLGGRFLRDLTTLAATIKRAAAFIGCDSGPAHLAGALGAPTFALFGPSNPDEWAPIGPAVTIIAPDTPRDMMWLAPDDVIAELARL